MNGEKYRKEHCGKQFLNNFYLPGVDGAPLTATDPEEYDAIILKVKMINSLGSVVRVDLDAIADLDKAATLAIKLQSLLDEISQQPKFEE